MKYTLNQTLAGLCLGLALAAPARATLAAGPVAASQTRLATDVRLYQADSLVGQTLGSAGVPRAGVTVALLADERQVAEVVSGDSGYFVIKNVKPGVYTLASGESRTTVRAWSGEVAPPTAAELAVVSSGPAVVRGQTEGGVNGGTVVAVVGATAVAAGAAVAISVANDDAS